MDLEDVSGVGKKGLEHEVGDGFVSFGVLYDGLEVRTALDCCLVDL